jgi:mRNA-degrading endonuclease YafQ of YafQ-DinJ toxin-antitoxin module
MLKISFTNQYLKDLEMIKRRHLPKSELDEVVKLTRQKTRQRWAGFFLIRN